MITFLKLATLSISLQKKKDYFQFLVGKFGKNYGGYIEKTKGLSLSMMIMKDLFL